MTLLWGTDQNYLGKRRQVRNDEQTWESQHAMQVNEVALGITMIGKKCHLCCVTAACTADASLVAPNASRLLTDRQAGQRRVRMRKNFAIGCRLQTMQAIGTGTAVSRSR